MINNETVLNNGSRSRSVLRSVGFKDVILEDSFLASPLKNPEKQDSSICIRENKGCR